MLRVPVAMAVTKLLLTLPEETLHTRLPRFEEGGREGFLIAKYIIL